MALVNRTFTLDITPGAIPQVVKVSEYDVNRSYTVTLIDEGGVFEIPSGTTATVEGTIGGNGFSESATVSGNTITFTLTESMTAKVGDVWCKIKLTQNSQPIQTCAFVLAVDRAGVEADTILHSPGFQEQINEGIAEYFDNDPPFFELPSGGQSGQALLSDGSNGAYWGEAQGGGTGLTDDLKQALLDCFENVAWINDQGQTYYNALYAALYPPKTLVSISAVFTQGSAVIYDTDSLDTLKQYLTVTATYDDTSTGVVTNYTLSGTLTEGTSTITVLYGGKTTTFDVVVTGTSVNYEVVGNPVFDGTWLIPASSNGGFVKTPEVFNPQSNTWIIRTEIETPASSSGSQDVINSVDANNASARGVLVEINQGFYFPYLSSGGTSWDISTPVANAGISLTASTVYLFEMYFDGTKYGVRASTDNGATWSKDWSKSSTTPIYGSYAVGFGIIRNAVYNGKINLAKTEIYIGGNLWWSAM